MWNFSLYSLSLYLITTPAAAPMSGTSEQHPSSSSPIIIFFQFLQTWILIGQHFMFFREPTQLFDSFVSSVSDFRDETLRATLICSSSMNPLNQMQNSREKK
jgi:hypothetical protein